MVNVFLVNLLDHLNKSKRKLYIEIIKKSLSKNHLQKFCQVESPEVKKLSCWVIMLTLLNQGRKWKLQVSTKTDITCH